MKFSLTFKIFVKEKQRAKKIRSETVCSNPKLRKENRNLGKGIQLNGSIMFKVLNYFKNEKTKQKQKKTKKNSFSIKI